MSTVRATEYFAVLPESLIHNTEISDGAVRLYAVLRRHADNQGECYPSRKRLSDLLGCSLNTVDRRIGELAEHGWLVIEARFDEQGDRTSNHYVVAATVGGGGPKNGATGGPKNGATGGPKNGALTRAMVEPEPSEPFCASLPFGDERTEPLRRPPQPANDKPAATKPRPRDAVFDAITEAVGLRAPITDQTASRVGKLKRSLSKAHDGTPPEELAAMIRARAERYRRRWPNMTLSVESLGKHWESLDGEAALAVREW